MGDQPNRDVLRDQRLRKAPDAESIDMGVYLKYADLFPHLNFDTELGWGWLPPSDEVFDALKYVEKNITPSKMLEIGYYAGHSTSYWAELMPKCEITSCCPDHLRWLETHRDVQRQYAGKVEVVGVKSPEILKHFNGGHEDFHRFPFVFIDGSHLCEDVFTDIHVALRLHADWMLFDNASDRGVQMAISWYELKGVLKKVKRWEYLGLNKGKTRYNDLSLYKVICPHPLDL